MIAIKATTITKCKNMKCKYVTFKYGFPCIDPDLISEE